MTGTTDAALCSASVCETEPCSSITCRGMTRIENGNSWIGPCSRVPLRGQGLVAAHRPRRRLHHRHTIGTIANLDIRQGNVRRGCGGARCTGRRIVHWGSGWGAGGKRTGLCRGMALQGDQRAGQRQPQFSLIPGHSRQLSMAGSGLRNRRTSGAAGRRQPSVRRSPSAPAGAGCGSRSGAVATVLLAAGMAFAPDSTRHRPQSRARRSADRRIGGAALAADRKLAFVRQLNDPEQVGRQQAAQQQCHHDRRDDDHLHGTYRSFASPMTFDGRNNIVRRSIT